MTQITTNSTRIMGISFEDLRKSMCTSAYISCVSLFLFSVIVVILPFLFYIFAALGEKLGYSKGWNGKIVNFCKKSLFKTSLLFLIAFLLHILLDFAALYSYIKSLTDSSNDDRGLEISWTCLITLIIIAFSITFYKVENKKELFSSYISINVILLLTLMFFLYLDNRIKDLKKCDYLGFILMFVFVNALLYAFNKLQKLISKRLSKELIPENN